MYIAYWVNWVTGQLYTSHRPQDNPTTSDWHQVNDAEWELLVKVAQYAWGGKYSFWDKKRE